MLRLITFIIALIWSFPALAQSEADIQIGLSDETVAITSSFDGAEIVVFGSVENADENLLKQDKYDIVVTLSGPPKRVTVRKKEWKFGIWVNGDERSFVGVPSSYAVATTRPLDQITQAKDLKILEIGFDNLTLRQQAVTAEPQPETQTSAETDQAEEDEDLDSFRRSLVRLKASQGLFVRGIGDIRYLSPTLFKATLRVPANVPIGHHRARAYLFADGEFVTTRSVLLNVRKQGFEQAAYDLAHRNGLLYGIIAVLVAMATGWLASVVFKKD
ncbi:MAG: TIGR02186 family protein [Pseudomonadota bacterium]